jgi:hypothetical protein
MMCWIVPPASDDEDGPDPLRDDSSGDEQENDQWDNRAANPTNDPNQPITGPLGVTDDGKGLPDDFQLPFQHIPDPERSPEDALRERCERYIAEWQREADKHAQTTNLGQRVADWQDRLIPALEEEERRQAFDIHHYGRHIISRISTGDDKELAEPKVMNFETAIAGQERYQVCRYFLATLQLV